MKDSIVPPTYLFGRVFFKEGSLDWTMVRPPQLTIKPYTGKYRVRESGLPIFDFKISRADVADFMIKAAEDPGSIHKIVGVSN